MTARPPSFPESFTLALSYLPGAEAYASLICTKQSFNQMLAEILFKALEGGSFNMTDGSRNYNGVKNHVLDPVHKTRTELKHDQKFKEMKDGLKKSDKKVKEAKSEEEKKQAADDRKRKLEEVSQYAKARYQQVLTSTIEQVRSEHPELFDEKGKFTGRAITSNGAEGGNWRVKNAVRVPYARSDSAAGKSILATIRDSISTIRGGRAAESIANMVGAFTFGSVMMT
jgi:Skp family chaperone for outer membrane proteins